MTSAGGNSFPYIYEKENGGFAVKGELYEVNEETLIECSFRKSLNAG